jgi:hypothetical protein
LKELTMDIKMEEDPTPFVLFIARTLRESAKDPHLRGTLSDMSGVLALRSVCDPQRATLRFDREVVTITHGALDDADAVVEVEIGGPLTFVDTRGDLKLVAEADEVLHPTLQQWRQGAMDFWALSHEDRGMPRRLIVNCSDDDSDALVLGDGLPSYEIRGPRVALERIFFGVDSILEAAFAGDIAVNGTLPQLSVLTGASWKARFQGGR